MNLCSAGSAVGNTFSAETFIVANTNPSTFFKVNVPFNLVSSNTIPKLSLNLVTIVALLISVGIDTSKSSPFWIPSTTSAPVVIVAVPAVNVTWKPLAFIWVIFSFSSKSSSSLTLSPKPSAAHSYESIFRPFSLATSSLLNSTAPDFASTVVAITFVSIEGISTPASPNFT